MKTPISTRWDKYNDEWEMRDADGNCIGSVGTTAGEFDKDAKQDALQFVLAVNAYDAFVDACDALVEADRFDDSELLGRAVRYARTALALIKEKQ